MDLKLNDDQTILPDLTTGEIGLQSAPVVAKDIILIGAAFREGMTPRSMRNNKGYVRGFDVRTGKRLWIFHTIPVQGRVGLRNVGERVGRIHRQHRRVDADHGGRAAWAWCTCRWNRPPAITTAATGRATTCTARAWSAWI